MPILEVTGDQRALARAILDKVDEKFAKRDADEAERLSPFVQALNDLKTAVAASGTATAAALGAFVPAVNAAMAMESPAPIVNIPAPQVTPATSPLVCSSTASRIGCAPPISHSTLMLIAPCPFDISCARRTCSTAPSTA